MTADEAATAANNAETSVAATNLHLDRVIDGGVRLTGWEIPIVTGGSATLKRFVGARHLGAIRIQVQ